MQEDESPFHPQSLAGFYLGRLGFLPCKTNRCDRLEKPFLWLLLTALEVQLLFLLGSCTHPLSVLHRKMLAATPSIPQNHCTFFSKLVGFVGGGWLEIVYSVVCANRECAFVVCFAFVMLVVACCFCSRASSYYSVFADSVSFH